MTSVNFFPVVTPTADPCGICHVPLNNGESVVAHEGEGVKHPFHLDCIKRGVQHNYHCCSFCLKPFHLDSLFSGRPLRDLKIKLLKKVFISKSLDILAIGFTGAIAGKLGPNFWINILVELFRIDSAVKNLKFGAVNVLASVGGAATIGALIGEAAVKLIKTIENEEERKKIAGGIILLEKFLGKVNIGISTGIVIGLSLQMGRLEFVPSMLAAVGTGLAVSTSFGVVVKKVTVIAGEEAEGVPIKELAKGVAVAIATMAIASGTVLGTAATIAMTSLPEVAHGIKTTGLSLPLTLIGMSSTQVCMILVVAVIINGVVRLIYSLRSEV